MAKKGYFLELDKDFVTNIYDLLSISITFIQYLPSL